MARARGQQVESAQAAANTTSEESVDELSFPWNTVDVAVLPIKPRTRLLNIWRSTRGSRSAGC